MPYVLQDTACPTNLEGQNKGEVQVKNLHVFMVHAQCFEL